MTSSSLRRLAQSRAAWVGGALVALLCCVAVFGPLFQSYDPNASDFVSGHDPFGMPVGPGTMHWFGTDVLYRDSAEPTGLRRAHLAARSGVCHSAFERDRRGHLAWLRVRCSARAWPRSMPS